MCMLEAQEDEGQEDSLAQGGGGGGGAGQHGIRLAQGVQVAEAGGRDDGDGAARQRPPRGPAPRRRRRRRLAGLAARPALDLDGRRQERDRPGAVHLRGHLLALLRHRRLRSGPLPGAALPALLGHGHGGGVRGGGAAVRAGPRRAADAVPEAVGQRGHAQVGDRRAGARGQEVRRRVLQVVKI